MSWIIDKDCFADKDAKPRTNSNAVGVAGPREYQGDGSELKYKFRMMDDDGEIVYYGRCDSCDDDNAFGPLDDFGTPNYGCTRIDYLINGKWEML